MDTQYTPTYNRLWNREFTLLTIAELLLCISCYMTIPLLPFRLTTEGHASSYLACLTIVVFIIGVCISGFFGSWLIQNYRRNKVFLISALCLGATILGLSAFEFREQPIVREIEEYTLLAVCFASGAVFGTAKRVLSCTLLIDKTESCHRTDANYTAIWISRLTVIVGPILALLLRDELRGSLFYIVGAAMSLASAVLVMCVKFPFRAPEEGVHLVSIDSFFLPRGATIALVIALITAALGIMMTTRMTVEFCSSVMAGFVVAALALHIPAVKNARFASAVGNALAIIAILAMFAHDDVFDATLKPMLFGFGIALSSSEQLYKLLNSCDHCQRSTAESTYFLSSDGGLFLGIAAGWQLTTAVKSAEQVVLALLVVATIICSLNVLLKKKQAKHHA